MSVTTLKRLDFARRRGSTFGFWVDHDVALAGENIVVCCLLFDPVHHDVALAGATKMYAFEWRYLVLCYYSGR